MSIPSDSPPHLRESRTSDFAGPGPYDIPTTQVSVLSVFPFPSLTTRLSFLFPCHPWPFASPWSSQSSHPFSRANPTLGSPHPFHTALACPFHPPLPTLPGPHAQPVPAPLSTNHPRPISACSFLTLHPWSCCIILVILALTPLVSYMLLSPCPSHSLMPTIPGPYTLTSVNRFCSFMPHTSLPSQHMDMAGTPLVWTLR